MTVKHVNTRDMTGSVGRREDDGWRDFCWTMEDKMMMQEAFVLNTKAVFSIEMGASIFVLEMWLSPWKQDPRRTPTRAIAGDKENNAYSCYQ